MSGEETIAAADVGHDNATPDEMETSRAWSGTDGTVRALIGRGSIYTAAASGQLIVSAILLPVLTRTMPVQEYGVVALAILVGGLVGAFAGAGMPVALSRAYFGDEAGPSVARRLSIGAAIPALLVVATAELTSGVWTSLVGNVHGALALRIAVLATIPSAVVGAASSFLRCQDHAIAFVAVTTTASVASTVLGIVAADMSAHDQAAAYMVGNLIGLSLAGGLAVILVMPRHGLFPSRRELTAALRMGTPLIPQGIAWLILALGDRAVIQHLDGRVAVGRYQIAYTMGAVGLSLVTALYSAVPPIIFGRKESRPWENLDVALRTTKLLAAPLAAGLALGGPALVRIFIPTGYGTSQLGGVTAAVAASTLPWAIYGMRTGVLIWHKRTPRIAGATVIACVCNIGLVWVLLPPFGLTGAAFATLIAYWILAGLMWLATHEIARVTPSARVRETWAVATLLIVAGGAAPVTPTWLVIRLTASLIVASLGLLATRKLLQGGLHV
jgi:O-antigen/teichoic acid export membrane protein